jgi:hypothetical protein
MSAQQHRDTPLVPLPDDAAAGNGSGELIAHLEPDQLVLETERPLPPARLGRRALLGLWFLRAFTLVVGLMVIYTFIVNLH